MASDATDASVPTSPSTTRHALLIASPWRDLKGPLHDVDAMSTLLRRYDFRIMQLRGNEATRNNIIRDWKCLISRLGRHDTALIYYSGHGGLLEIVPSTNIAPARYQFLVPNDYDPNNVNEFLGILDIEISQLVHQMTKRTDNVTLILDCCHSGRMARDPGHAKTAVPKAVERLQVKSDSIIAGLLDQLQNTGRRTLDSLLKYSTVEGNSRAVRLVAAAENEKAYEFRDRPGRRMGAMTKALIASLEDALSINMSASSEEQPSGSTTGIHGVSWESVGLRVGQMVNAEFPDQHPHVEGPHQRLVFSCQTKQNRSLLVSRDGSDLVIHGGLVAGVRRNDIYVIMPPNHQQMDQSMQLGEARVLSVSGFQALLRPNSPFEVSNEGALAFIKRQAPFQWPVKISEELRDHRHVVGSRFIRPVVKNDADMVIGRITSDDRCVSLHGRSNVELGSWSFEPEGEDYDFAVEDAVEAADDLGRAEHLLTLKPSNHEKLDCSFGFTISTVTHEVPIQNDGKGKLMCDDHVVVKLQNSSESDIFVSVFDINVKGKVTHLSPSWPTGIRLPAGGRYTLGRFQHAAYFDEETSATPGLKLSWPQGLGISGTLEVPESFLFIVSDVGVDVRYFANFGRSDVNAQSLSGLELLAYTLANGSDRDCEAERPRKDIRWDIFHFPFTLIRT